MNDRTIKNNIAALRKQSGLTQTEVADKIGISRTAYRNLESGDTRMYNENIYKIATVLDRTAEEVVLGFTREDEDEKKLEDVRNEYSSRNREILRECESRVAEFRDQNETLKNYVEALKEIIKSKDEIIAMLRSYRDGK